MAVTYEGDTSAAQNTSGAAVALVLNVPAGVQEDDILVVSVTARSGTGIVPVEAGWNEIGNGFPGGSASAAGYAAWRVASASEPASYSFTFTGSPAKKCGGMALLRGADTADPIGDSSFRLNAAGGFYTYLSVDVDRDDSILVGLCPSTGVTVNCVPAGYTQEWLQGTTSGSGCGNLGCRLNDPAVGATGDLVCAGSDGQGQTTALLVVQPPLPVLEVPAGIIEVEVTPLGAVATVENATGIVAVDITPLAVIPPIRVDAGVLEVEVEPFSAIAPVKADAGVIDLEVELLGPTVRLLTDHHAVVVAVVPFPVTATLPKVVGIVAAGVEALAVATRPVNVTGPAPTSVRGPSGAHGVEGPGGRSQVTGPAGTTLVSHPAEET